MVTAAQRRHSLKATRRLTILAQDPSVTVDGRLVRAEIEVPTEELLPGPCGYRVNVVDYDATTNMLYAPPALGSALVSEDDPFAGVADAELLGNPGFHAQNVYAIVMRILARFEFALGRRVPWGSNGHQLHVAPHAFADANAFYSREDRGIFFGYFTADTGGSEPETVFTCLSHDIVAHETTHAILDGLRSGFMEPSLPDQAAFHEGFADVVALLSVFALPETIRRLLAGSGKATLIDPEEITEEKLRTSVLFGLGNQMGAALSGLRGQALRRSVSLRKGHDYNSDPEFQEEHNRGELIAASLLNGFLAIWAKRVRRIGPVHEGMLDLELVVEEGATAADHLLTMAIRAIDYCPPVDLNFHDYLSALLTVDREVVPDDRFGYRDALLECFGAFGITPSTNAGDDGTWTRCDKTFVHSQTHFDSMLRDSEEVFRFIWENREPLQIGRAGYVEVQSVRPSFRISPDGFMLRETIVEYTQRLTVTAAELRADHGISCPSGIRSWQAVTILAGGTIIFDEYGQVKYQIAHHLDGTVEERERQSRRIAYLWERNLLHEPVDSRGRFAMMHANRAMTRSSLEVAAEPAMEPSRG